MRRPPIPCSHCGRTGAPRVVGGLPTPFELGAWWDQVMRTPMDRADFQAGRQARRAYEQDQRRPRTSLAAIAEPGDALEEEE